MSNEPKEGCFLQTLNAGCIVSLGILGILVLFATLPLLCESITEPWEKARGRNDSLRLFWQARRDSLRQAQADSIAALGKWAIGSTTNPLDDTKTVQLRLQADEGRSRRGDVITMILRCKSNTTEIYINWEDYLGLDETTVITRIGEGRARTRTWTLSTDNRSTFYRGSDIDFIKALMQDERLVAQTTPYNENPVTAIFDLRGLPEAIRPLRETCQW